jgi:hypothetical protein
MSYWREFVKDPEEIKLFEALEDPKYEWRTLAALQRASGMSEADILRVLQSRPSLVRETHSRSGEPLWTLQERYWRRPGLVQIMDFISHTVTRT